MILTGIGDEAGVGLEAQINATRHLGWKHIEMRTVQVPGFAKGNFHDIPEKAFDIAAGRLEEAGLRVYCFGSAIANWSKRISDPFQVTLDEVARCIPRMQRVGAKLVRVMSFKPAETADKTPPEVFRRIGEVTRMFREAGLQPVHENCMNHGGMSWRHGLELLEKCPGLKWVFDTGNPVFNPDRSKPQAVAAPGRVGILGAHPRARHPHPRQGRDLCGGEKRLRLQISRPRPGPGAGDFTGRPGARLRRGHFHRAARGRRFPRRIRQSGRDRLCLTVT